MNVHVADPVTGAAYPLSGRNALVISQLPDGSSITPDDFAFYDPPLELLVCGAGDIAIVPAGIEGDHEVIYPMGTWQTVPVLAKQVLATGTTATAIFGQQVYNPPVPIGPRADSTLVTADSTIITADSF